MKTRLVRVATFSAAHRYFNPQLSREENEKLYGSLYRDAGFGHNFQYEAHFEGEISPLTGMVVNLSDVDRWMGAVTRFLDHQYLNELAAFSGMAPTPERIAQAIFAELHNQIAQDSVKLESADFRLMKIRLYEGESLWAEAFGFQESSD